MKNAALILAALLTFIFPAISPAEKGKSAGAYNPKIEYAGDYQANLLFYSSSNGQFWRRLPKLDRLERVTCPDAADQLARYGVWKGHLNTDGSCGTYDEPDSWAMGNWLNYRDSSGTGAK